MLMFFTESIEMHVECREFIRALIARIPGTNSTYPCSSMLYVVGLVTALCGGAPIVCAIAALVYGYLLMQTSWSKALGVFSPARDAGA